MKTLNIVKRNLQIFINMKTSSMILILAPILLIALISVALQDTSLKNIHASVYSETNFEDELSKSILQKITENSIKIIFSRNLQSCKEMVKTGEVELCIELKTPNENEIGQKNQNVILHVDFSKQRTVWTIIGKVQGIIESESNKEREVLTNNIKTNSQNALSELEAQEKKINEIEEKINIIEDQTIQELENKIEEQNEKQQKIISTINEINSEISKIKLYSGLAGLYTDEFEDIENGINTIESTIQSSSYNIETQIQTIKIEINKIQSEIKKLKKSINETKEKLKDVNEMDFNSIMNPIKTTYESVLDSQVGEISKDLKFLDYLFPSFLAFFIIFNSIIFSASIRLRERKSKAHLRNSLSKYKNRHFIFGDFITSLLLITMQTFIIIFIASFFLNIDLFSNLTSLILIVIISVSIFTLIGLAIGSAFSTQESVIISSISFSLLLFVFSSIVTPTETLPTSIGKLVSIMPLTLLETKMRICMIFENSLKFSILEKISLIIISTISILTMAIFTRKNKEKNI